MKLAFFDDYKLGVVVGDQIVDVSSVARGIKALGPQDVIRTVIEKWSAYKGRPRSGRPKLAENYRACKRRAGTAHALSVHDIARQERVSAAYIYILLRLPWLAYALRRSGSRRPKNHGGIAC